MQSWYFDLTTAMNYWGKDRLYHHTPPVSLIFALREAMRIVIEEGLENRWERHRINQLALIAGLEAMGLELLVKNPVDRLPTVTAVMIPSGIDDVKVRNQLLDEFHIEIAGGLGPLKAKIWRVGLMGHCSQKQYVLLFLAALEKTLIDQGFRAPKRRGRRRRDPELHPCRHRSRNEPLRKLESGTVAAGRVFSKGSEL